MQHLRKAVVIAVAVLASIPARGQIDTGSIVGSVSDPSGAAISGASITVTDQLTGVVQHVAGNRYGQYQVPALIPGSYTVRAVAPGFAPQQFAGVRIDVQSRVALDFTLKVGSAQQEVTVTDETVGVLQTQSADLGEVVDSQAIDSLPLMGTVGRNYAELALLNTGVGKFYSGPNEVSDGFSVNGNSELQNYFALDGVDNNSNSANLIESTTQSVEPPPDALAEFRIQTRTYSPEFGNAAGGVVNASIKGGTNQFHGDLWDYLRNDALDANSYFNNLYGDPRAFYKQNQFGFTSGGPIVRNRTFFFGDLQQVIFHTQQTQTSTVPTPLMKGTSASEPGVYDLRELNGIPLQTVVPSQDGCITGTVVQSACVDPTGLKFLQAYPDPNIASQVALEGTNGSFGQTNYQYIVPQPTTTWSADARIDQTIDPVNRIYGRYSIFRNRSVNTQWTADPVIGASNFASTFNADGQSFVASYLHTFSAAMLNEARLGYNRILGSNDPPSSLPLGQSSAGQFGLTGVPVNSYTYGIPGISVNGLQTLGDSSYRPQHYVSQVYQLLDDFTALRGRHSLKFGFQYHRLTSTFLDLANVQGEISASGQYSDGGRFGVPDLLLGDMAGASYETIEVPHLFQPGYNLYAQDNWRVADRLVLTYGLRYELYSPLLERSNEVSNFSPGDGGTLVVSSPGDHSWYGRSLINPDPLNLAPRLGFSWQGLPRMVVRGGYGIFYQHHNRYGSESVLNLNPPFLVQSTLSQPNGSTTPVFTLKDGFPSQTLMADNGVTPPLYELQIRAQDPSQRTSYVSQPSFGTQWQIAGGTTLSVDYVGNFARRMGRIMNANQGIPEWDAQNTFLGAYFQYQNLISLPGVGPQNPHLGTQSAFLEYLRNDGNTNFNSLQASLDHRLSGGLLFGLSYEWSHSISDFNVPINGNFVGENAYYDHAHERSDQTLDVRNRFVAHALWAIPVGRGARYFSGTPGLRDVIGGWQLNTIVTAQGGNPFTIYGDQADQTGQHDGYADCVGDPFAGATGDHHRYVVGGGGLFINPAAYGDPTTDQGLGPAYRLGHLGTCRPYSVHAPGYKDTDLSVFRNFPIHEDIRAEFRAEATNAWNNVNLAAPNAYIGNLTSFGTVTGTVGNPRILQFALKIYY